MSENIENLIEEINDIIKAETKVDSPDFYLRVTKEKLVDAVREEYKNDTKTRL